MQMEFCDEHNCANCCFDAKVPLLIEDINRIIMYGYYDAYFVEEQSGIKTLRTREDGSCVFYNKQERVCDIYTSRPERCKLNPYTICEQTLEPGVDKDCKHCNDCHDEKIMHKRMSEYLITLEKEIRWRRETGYYL